MANGNLLFFPPKNSTETEKKIVDMEQLATRAYNWLIRVERPQETKGLETIYLNDFHSLTLGYGNHISLFRKNGCPTYMRVYWPNSRKVIYYIVDNYSRVNEYSPEITALLIRNGVYAYLQLTDKQQCFEIFKLA